MIGCVCLVAALGGQQFVWAAKSGLGEQNETSSAVGVYHEPNGWLLAILREFFTDIDWHAIAVARDQIEKFVRKVDRLLSSFRSRKDSNKEVEAEPGERTFGRNWFGLGTKSAGLGQMEDSTGVKEMLQRVACFLGYLRLLNNSNEALAELDASKVITNLFSGSKMNSSGFFSGWFG